MSETKTYYETRLPDLIEKLKSQVTKNMNIINKEVESGIGEEKYINVLKGRRLAVGYCLTTLDKIAKLNADGLAYKNETLPILIERLKEMVDITLGVIDIEIEDDSEESLTEDKYHFVLRARDIAGTDTEYVLKCIDNLENELKIDKTGVDESVINWTLEGLEQE